MRWIGLREVAVRRSAEPLSCQPIVAALRRSGRRPIGTAARLADYRAGRWGGAIRRRKGRRMTQDAREHLVNYLKKRAFEPVLQAGNEGRSEAEKRRLEDVKEATRAEIDRYEHYGSAEDVYENFKSDLDSEPATKIHSELKSLGLPSLDEIAGDFENEAQKLGVH
jgi:hypothetical protein